MAHDFDEFHGELRSVAGDLLAKDRSADWAVLADAGWTGLEVGEDLGGAGATFAEVAVICEEMGRAASANSYLGGAVLGVGVLTSLQPSESRDRLLRATASGTARTAVVVDGFTLDDGRLTGHAEFVPDALDADTLLVVVDGGVVVADATVTPRPVLDGTRRLATVSAKTSEATEVLRFAGDAMDEVRRLRERAAVAIACDSLGLSEAMLSATVAYVKVRHQFGRAIGSFQAVKHACADMLTSLSVSRQLVSAAVDAVTERLPDADVAVAMAKSHTCAAAVDIAGKAMQLHGGIGYTWESGLHVYLKRAALNRSLFGSPAAHRQELAKRYL
ncbi:acyl-CoA dehydrogenase family protein [Mycobacterium sp. ITM-2016-00318]|uniref:acyl-CoA dehydrogenase family protein n=1 Tax=Mycobacterium sp. ITM-2016-00318 TaxID=2099693 RepID=UPI001E37FADA|nr:acyl-CoA dehydrogenase family protein [Mycobacterium sp. ITM-2016-00318]WNG90672.1 acyl-CoA dehydrogenase family protein [Mycobacterium sp. ITM-2016-00318]